MKNRMINHNDNPNSKNKIETKGKINQTICFDKIQKKLRNKRYDN